MMIFNIKKYKGEALMKRMLLITLILAVSFLVASCVDIVGTVKSIQITDWTPSEFYEVDEDVELTNVEVVVSFDDGAEDQTFTLADTSVSVRGSGVAFDGTDVSLNTSEEGDKKIIISYDTVSVTVEFTVVEHLVRATGTNDGTAIQAKIDHADFAADDTLYFAAGDYDIDIPIKLDKANISVIGSEYGTSKLVSGSHVVIFNVDAKGITIENLSMTTTHIDWVQNYDKRDYAGIISLRDGAGNSDVNDWETDFNGEVYTTIKNNVIFGSYSAQYNYDEMDWFGIACNYQEDANYTGLYDDNKMSFGTLYAEGNVIYNVRQGIQLGSNNVGLIYNNNIFNTKGGILSYGKAYIQWMSDEYEDNYWNATIQGFRNNNEQDIVYHSGTVIPNDLSGSTDWHSYSDILIMSENNNNAFVIDRRTVSGEEDELLQNRSHVYIREQTSDENPFFDNSTPVIGYKSTGAPQYDAGGHVRSPLWRDDIITSVRVALGLTNGYDFGDGVGEKPDGEALVEGGFIYVWNEETLEYELFPPSNYPTE
jgi:predicted small secreted protein